MTQTSSSADSSKLKQIMERRWLERQKTHKATAERTAKVRAPIIKQLVSNPEISAALQESTIKRTEYSREFAERRLRKEHPKIITPNAANVRSRFDPSSVTVLVPPYPVHVFGEFGPGEAEVNAMSNGYMSTNDNGGGSTSIAYAGIGVLYTPQNSAGLMSASCYTTYDWAYYIDACLNTADVSGNIGWVIYRADNGDIVYQKFYDLFSGHVGWLDDYEDWGEGIFNTWADPVSVDNGTQYVFEVTITILADDSKFGCYSIAMCDLSATTHWFVLQEYARP